jgi:protein NrfD
MTAPMPPVTATAHNGNHGAQVLPTEYAGQTYYDLPATKPAPYGWLVSSYFFVGGLAAASQFIATAADWFDPDEARPAVRAGRYLALGGALLSPVLLIADLHTPRRWYNMLRIFRPTSAMSIGSWALTAFGGLSGVVALGQALDDFFGLRLGRRLARVASLPASGAAAVVAAYTGTLLASTNIPLWTAASPHIAPMFASSAVSTGTAAISLLAPPADHRLHRRLTWLATIAGAFELVHGLIIQRRWRARHVDAPLRRPALGAAWYAGALGLGVLAPLAIHLAELLRGGRRPSRRTRRAATWASLLVLAGGFVLRAVFVFGGRESGRRPRDYFGQTQFPGDNGPSGRRRRTE